MSDVIMKKDEDVLVFVLTLYWDSVCWICHFALWWADDTYVFEARLGCRTGVQPHN
jgi:hypothetical protein